jgi:hypothetical protein
MSLLLLGFDDCLAAFAALFARSTSAIAVAAAAIASADVSARGFVFDDGFGLTTF